MQSRLKADDIWVLTYSHCSIARASEQIPSRCRTYTYLSPSYSEHLPQRRASQHAHVRRKLSFTTKSEIQALVSAALRPAYKDKLIDSDQYTEINKDVSRKLYDSLPSLMNGKAKADGTSDWSKRAASEVELALKNINVDTALFHE